MSSVSRRLAVNAKALPDVQFVGGPYYRRETDPQKLLFPFILEKGALEIQVINDFDVTSETPPLGILTIEEGGIARRMGGLHLVQSIGPNFQTYIQNVVWQTSDESPVSYKASNIKVYKPGLVTRVQQLSSQNLPNDIDPDYSYTSSDKAPVDDFLLDIEGYGTTYAFEKPLVVSVNATRNVSPFDSLGKQYITFYTSWDH